MFLTVSLSVYFCLYLSLLAWFFSPSFWFYRPVCHLSHKRRLSSLSTALLDLHRIAYIYRDIIYRRKTLIGLFPRSLFVFLSFHVLVSLFLFSLFLLLTLFHLSLSLSLSINLRIYFSSLFSFLYSFFSLFFALYLFFLAFSLSPSQNLSFKVC